MRQMFIIDCTYEEDYKLKDKKGSGSLTSLGRPSSNFNNKLRVRKLLQKREKKQESAQLMQVQS